MQHYTCDRCGGSISAERYEARVEIRPAFDPEELCEEHLEEDYLSAVSEMLSSLQNTSEFNGDENTQPQQFTYDLCRQCYGRFLKDPLGREATRRLNFSKN